MFILKKLFVVFNVFFLSYSALLTNDKFNDNASWGLSYFEFNDKISSSKFISLETNYIEKNKSYMITTSFLYPIKQNITNYNYLLNLRGAKLSENSLLFNLIGTRFSTGFDLSIGGLNDSSVNEKYIQFGLGGSFTIEFSYKRIFAKLLIGHHFQLENNSYNVFSLHLGYALNKNWITSE